MDFIPKLLHVYLLFKNQIYLATWRSTSLCGSDWLLVRLCSLNGPSILAWPHLHQSQGSPSLHCLTFAFASPALEGQDSLGIYGHCFKNVVLTFGFRQ